MRVLALLLSLVASAAVAQSVSQPGPVPVPVGTPGNIPSFGSGGALGDSAYNPNTMPVTPTGGSAPSPLANIAARTISVTDFGAVCDAISKTGGIATAGSTSYSVNTSYSPLFTQAAVGKAITIAGAGPGGSALATSIVSVSSGVATLATAASTNSSLGTNSAYVAFVRTSGDGVHSYAPGDTISVSGGTSTVAATFTVGATTLLSGTLTGGTGYAIGDVVYLTAASGTQVGQARIQITAVSSGVPTAYVVLNGGVFSGSNPTIFTQTTSGTNGSGLTITSPVYGIAQEYSGPLVTTIATHGSYTGSTPANPVATTSSGTGQGATFDVFWKQGGVYAYGTDNSGAFLAAISSVNASAIGSRPSITLPSTSCGLASTVSVNNNFIVFDGRTGPAIWNGQSSAPSSASITWLGAQDGVALQFAPVVSASMYELSGNAVKGITFYGNDIMGVGAQFLSAGNFQVEDVDVEEATVAGVDLNIATGGSFVSNGTAQGWLIRNFFSHIYWSAGTAIRIDGNASYDNSNGIVDNVYATFRHGEVLTSLRTGHNKFTNFFAYGYFDGLAPAIEFNCSTGGYNGGSNQLDNISTGTSGIIFRGTESCVTPAVLNNITDLDDSNATPWPEIGVGANVLVTYSSGMPVGVRKHGEVYFEGIGAGVYGASATAASGSYTMTIATAPNVVPGMVAQGSASVPDGDMILSKSGNTLTMSAPTTGALSSTAVTFAGGAQLCPEGGGGLWIDQSMWMISSGCLVLPATSPANVSLVPGLSDYVYVSVRSARVTNVLSSDATRNLIRLTLDRTAGFSSNSEIHCNGVTGVGGANTTWPIKRGNLVDAAHIDIQGATFSGSYTGGGRCWWYALDISPVGHQNAFNQTTQNWGGIQVQIGNPAATLVGHILTAANGSYGFVPVTGNGNQNVGPASWFNRKLVQCKSTVGSDQSNVSGTTTYAEVASGYRCNFFVWADPFSPTSLTANNSVNWSFTAATSNSTAGDGCLTGIGLNGTTPETLQFPDYAGGTTKVFAGVSGLTYGLTEGNYYATLLGASITGGQCTWDHLYTGVQVGAFE